MHRWKFSALAAAAVASASLYTPEAFALALGRITVQSALGEPLRAEIELPQITQAEAESLRATGASPETYRAQGMEHTPAAGSVRFRLQRRADGSAVLVLSSDRPMNDPFIDLVLDANSSSGRIVRGYTMLLDPPAMRRAPAAAPATNAQIAPDATRPATTDAGARTTTRQRAEAFAASANRQAPAAGSSADSVRVQAGDTAGRLANAHRPTGVSLDQMLVAMLRANPSAFVGNNVNRIKAGAVLQLPDEAAAQAVPVREARQIVLAQSRDFNAFRRRLASAAPSATVSQSARSASGAVQAQVQDQQPAATSPDKLTLSKGGVQAQKSTAAQIAKEKQASENTARMAELSKNISDLDKIKSASSPAPTAPAPAVPGVAVPVTPAVTPPAPAPAPATASTTAAAASVPAPSPASAPAPAASTPASAETLAPVTTPSPDAAASAASAPDSVAAAPARASRPAAPPVITTPEEPSFFDDMAANPMLSLLGGGILAGLLGYGAYTIVRRRRNAAAMDSSFLESRSQADSFFGASGGQRVNTANSGNSTTGAGNSSAMSSMAYSPSQLDAGGDVDPVAEADVYLAYGRDLQAEEILKEAIRHTPARTALHVKLAEIYAKRQDRKAFEATAGEVHRLTNGAGAEWSRLVDIGRDLDPGNTLYQPGGRPAVPGDTPQFVSTFTAGQPKGAVESMNDPISEITASKLDLDLDLGLTPPPAPASAAAAGGFAAAAAAAGAVAAARAPEPVAPLEPTTSPTPMRSTLPELDLGTLSQPPAPQAAAPAKDNSLSFETVDIPHTDPADSAPMEFDLGSLSLDLNVPSQPASMVQTLPDTVPAAMPDASDPLATKLALAEEFNAIGDTDGARTLVEEVIAESTGELKARAQKMLAKMG